MKHLLKRGLAGALMMALVPTTGFAATPHAAAYPAIANGLNIPLESPRRSAEQRNYGRYVLVDAEAAKLYMIEDGEVRDSMRVIVGKPSAATPEFTSVMHAATLNPYWNVPTDLARTLIAPRVLAGGISYLTDRGYEVVTRFSPDAEVLPPESVDWQAVAEGRETVLVRQRPGPANSMGQMKFGLLNGGGIFLHDTPRKELFDEADRNLSSGCVRLEDAPRLARWLLGHDPALASAKPEQVVPLPKPVPVVITYNAPAQILASAD